jgi:hypothetical protein
MKTDKLESVQFTKNVRTSAEAEEINLAYWYDQVAGEEAIDNDHCVEITVGVRKSIDLSRSSQNA